MTPAASAAATLLCVRKRPRSRALHAFPQSPLFFVKNFCEELNVDFSICEGWEKGGEGTKELAKVVCEIADSGKSNFKPL